MERLIKHFSHEHPLILDKDYRYFLENVVCYGCNISISKGSSVYTCSRSSSRRRHFFNYQEIFEGGSCDDFFLHETCAKLPLKMQHPMHLKHDLTLYSRPQYRSWSSWCNVCQGSADYCKRFIYQCISCEFDVCLRCTSSSSQERNFHHPGHEHHSLSFMPQQSLFHCHACGTEAKDSSYVCNSCTFWIHQSCASSPSTTLHSYHNHKLVLAYSIPEQYYTFLNYCGICNKRMNRSNWFYYCVDCKYFAHIKCAIPTEIEALRMLRSNVNETVEAEESNLLYLPLPDEPSMDAVVHQFIKKISLTDETATAPDHINHWAHADHPLVLFDEFFKTSNTSRMINGNDDQMLCDICVRPISTDPFYGCIQCKFFLHRLCTELPTELQHSSHPEHVLVSCKYNKPHSYIKCSECACICNGMFFCCKRCEFYLDVRCASLSREIVHEAHKHRLSQLKVSATVCKGCEKSIFGICYGCKACKFHLHKGCALLPSTVKHRWDDHSIPLVHPPVKNHPGLFYCEICEEEINTNYWLYFCRSCDQSFHTTCLYPYYGYSNIKFGATMKVKSHQHSLTFVGMKKHKLPPKFGSCRSCGNNILDGFPVLECEPCYFCLCTKCATSSTSHIIESPLLLRSSENENDKVDDASDFDEPNLVHFPLSDKRSQGTTIEQIVKAISLVDETTIAADHIYYHWTRGDHLLILFDGLEQNNSEMKIDEMLCEACMHPLSVDPFYGCVQCNFFLHRFCSELPEELQHPSHPQHKLLKVQLSDPFRYFECNLCYFECNLCRNCCNGVFYYCGRCDFYLDVKCASLTSVIKHEAHKRAIKHEAHKHRLSLLEDSGSVCRGCGKSISGMSFGCEICNFYLHISCAVLPGKVSHRSDQHPVRLIYPCIKDYQHSSCEICGGKINPNFWLYFCQDCNKSFHPSCLYPYYGFTNIKFGATKYNDNHRHKLTFARMKSNNSPPRCGIRDCNIPDGFPVFECETCDFRVCTECDESEARMRSDDDDDVKAVDKDDLMLFPQDDKWSRAPLIQKFIKASLKEDTNEVADRISGHWTHKDHELTLFDQLEQNNHRQTRNDEMICDACVECLSADRYYGCLQCNFFLHRFCAELPEELQHPLHPKHKLLRAQYTKPYHYFECDVCQERCNGVFYYCVSCNFYVDIKCASLPNTIKHQSHHQHPLRLLDIFDEACDGCWNPISGMGFGCKICDFFLHIRCVLLPGEVRHRSDHHPVFLIFPDFKNHSDLFFCEICEEEIFRYGWRYHCRDCKRSFHPSCLPHGFSNIKFGARNIKVYHHPHSLTFVAPREHEGRLNSICERCGDEISDGFPYLECKPCNIVFCMKCGDRKLLKNIN